MKKRKFPNQFLGVITGILLICLGMGCQKEDFSIQNLPTEELEASFFEYTEDAIVIEYDNLDELIIEKTENSLVLKNSGLFENIEEGNVIVTSSNTPHDEFILREVLSVQESGDNYMVETVVTTPYRAYSSYYFNSALSETIELREREVLYDLATVKAEESNVQSGFANLFNSFTDQIKDILVSKLPPAVSKPYKLTGFFGFEYNLGGQIIMETVHPHTQYAQNNANMGPYAGETVENVIGYTKNQLDSDNDGVSNIVEQYYNTNENDKKDFPILKKIVMEDFFIEVKPSLKFGKEFSYTAKDFIVPNKPPKQEVELMFSDVDTIKLDLSKSPLQDINYIPIPGLTSGAFGLAFSWHQLIEFSGSVNLDLYARLHTEPTNMVFGVIDFTSQTLNPEFRWESSDGLGNDFSLDLNSYLSSRLDMDVGAVVKAEALLKLGVGMGVAAYAGETNTAVFAVGGMITPYAYMRPSVTAGVGFKNIISSRIDFNDGKNFFGYGCLEFGPGIEIYAFSDGKDVLSLTNFLDLKKSLYNMEYDALGHLVGGKFCIGDVPCDGVKVDNFEIEEAGSGLNFLLKMKASSTDAGHPKYKLQLLDGQDVLDIPDLNDKEFTFGADEEYFFNSIDFASYLTGLPYTLRIQVVGKPECVSYIFRNSIVVRHCIGEPDPFEVQEATFETKKFFTNVQARAYCLSRGGMITREKLKEKINAGELCIDPTGFIAANDGKLNNITEAYVWTFNPSYPSLASVTVINPIRQDDGNYSYDVDYVPLSTVGSESAQLKCKCAN